MGLIDFLLKMLDGDSTNSTDYFYENDSWFEHEGEDHDVEDGYCLECDDDCDNL